MRLIADWRHAWRFHTVIGAALLATVDFAMSHLGLIERFLQPDTLATLAAVLPPDRMVKLNAYAAVALMVLRVVRQQIPARDAPPPPAGAPAKPSDGVSP